MCMLGHIIISLDNLNEKENSLMTKLWYGLFLVSTDIKKSTISGPQKCTGTLT